MINGSGNPTRPEPEASRRLGR